MNTLPLLKIDAWRYDHGWTWNNWFRVGEVPADLIDKTPRAILLYLRGTGRLNWSSAGKLAIEDDQYNLVIVAKGTREPLLAIEYGSAEQ